MASSVVAREPLIWALGETTTLTSPLASSGARMLTTPPDRPPAAPPETSIRAWSPSRITPEFAADTSS